MGVDYYECDSCDFGFRDDSEYCAYCECGAKFCSVKCGKLHNYREEYEEVAGDDDDDSDHDHYRGDRLEETQPITCVICRKEKHTPYILLQALLKHFNITEKEAVKIWKGQK